MNSGKWHVLLKVGDYLTEEELGGVHPYFYSLMPTMHCKK